jgi:hypothetical protein
MITMPLIVSVFTILRGYQSVIDICISKCGYSTQYWVDRKMILRSFLLLRFYVSIFKRVLFDSSIETQINRAPRVAYK